MLNDDTTAQFAERVAELREEHGENVALGDIAEIVESLMVSMQGDISAVEVRLHGEILALVDYIRGAKDEIAKIQPGQIKNLDIPVATDELDAIVGATEVATNAILDAAEALTEIATEVPQEQADKLTDLTTKIYEASNFQDITGQRITKVIATLRQIEAKVVALARAVGEEIEDAASEYVEKRSGDEALLNGPALPEAANTQDDIDALLASFD